MTATLTKLGDVNSYESSQVSNGVVPLPEAGGGRPPERGLGARSLHEFLEASEPVGSALDVDDVTAVQDAVEEGGGHHHVAGQHLRPVLDRLVGGDQYRGVLVAATVVATSSRNASTSLGSPRLGSLLSGSCSG